MKKILVVGANGQLGRTFQKLAPQYPDFEWTFADRSVLDISKAEQVASFFAAKAFDVCINCAAYTAVDVAETDEQLAFEVNVTAAAHLAQACAQQHTILFHYSTDFVFDGEGCFPYKEEMPAQPVNRYGHTKLQGEKAVLRLHPKSFILRTSWLYSEYGKNFFKTIRKLGHEREELGVVADQIGTPTYATDLALATMSILQKQTEAYGVYHYSNEGVASWYDFAQAIKAMDKFSANIKPLRSDQYPTPAKRPFYSVLDKSKLKEQFDLTIPYWRDSLEACIEQFLFISSKTTE